MISWIECALRKSTGTKLPIGHGFSERVRRETRRNNTDFYIRKIITTNVKIYTYTSGTQTGLSSFQMSRARAYVFGYTSNGKNVIVRTYVVFQMICQRTSITIVISIECRRQRDNTYIYIYIIFCRTWKIIAPLAPAGIPSTDERFSGGRTLTRVFVIFRRVPDVQRPIVFYFFPNRYHSLRTCRRPERAL